MKKYLINFILITILLSACTDEALYIAEPEPKQQISQEDLKEGFLIFTSHEDVKRAIITLKQGNSLGKVPLRSVSSDNYYIIDNEDFVSLADANKEAFMASLTLSERFIITTDPDELEYCMPDSIIADEYFSQIVNYSRMIQVGDTVYKFLGNGVVYVHEDHADSLYNITQVENPIINPGAVDENGMYYLKLNDYVNFMSNVHDQIPTPPDDSGNDYGDITLENGVTVNNVNSIYFYESDASLIHQLWWGLWGDYVLAINKFESNKRMVLGFYNLNYANIYAHTGANVRMQKEVLGIWWNIKSEQMALGWTGVEIIYKLPQYSTITPPAYINHQFEFQDTEDYLFEVSYDDYKSYSDVAMINEQARENALSKNNVLLNQIVESLGNKNGSYIKEDEYLHLICSANEAILNNAHHMNVEFSRQILPISLELGIIVSGNHIMIRNIDVGAAEVAELGKGCVYGAVKYNGQWRGARITKHI